MKQTFYWISYTNRFARETAEIHEDVILEHPFIHMRLPMFRYYILLNFKAISQQEFQLYKKLQQQKNASH